MRRSLPVRQQHQLAFTLRQLSQCPPEVRALLRLLGKITGGRDISLAVLWKLRAIQPRAPEAIADEVGGDAEEIVLAMIVGLERCRYAQQPKVRFLQHV